ncbi:MAG: hypothetical protein GX267_07975 [Fibrobacter sp.]|nr:hypothetical protein [Fibrobacter sp.]
MTNPILVIGGWAVDPVVLRPIFGDRAVYIDINHLLPSIANDQWLLNCWKQKLKDLLSPYCSEGMILAGWSTGAIAAAAIADLVNISKLVLLSATPSFCRRDSFRYGMRPQIVQNMITSINENKEPVLKQFYYQCGFTDILFDWSQYSIEELTCGLQFLIHADLLSIATLPDTCCQIHCLHGSEDRIIPSGAGKFLCNRLGGIWHQLSGPHAFFCDKDFKIENIITSIFPERNNQDVNF